MRYFFYIPGMRADAEVMGAQSLGGSESSGMYLAREMARRGHDVIAFTNTPGMSMWDGVKVFPIGQPEETWPLGRNFEQVASAVPHDVLIIQRAPAPFRRQYASKMNFFWMHDLARGRMAGNLKGTLWNCQGVLGVSEWHAAQIRKVYGLPENYVHVIRNGIDLSLFEAEPNYERKWRGKKLIYVSRPERGLINLVKEDGIMERLHKIDPEITLMVAHYDNTTPEMAPLYNDLWSKCAKLPNVELLGSLSKPSLAQAYYDAALLVYPTVPADQHEETSCMAIMECQAAGTPFVAAMNGAVPETAGRNPLSRGSLIRYAEDGASNPEDFIRGVLENIAIVDFVGPKARAHALENYKYEQSAEALEALVAATLAPANVDKSRLISHLLYTSDAVLAREVAKDEQLTGKQAAELKLYEFLDSSQAYQDHYARSAELFLKYTGGGGLETITGVPTGGHYGDVVPHVEALALRGAGRVLDYGGGVGAFALGLAVKFPELEIVCSDIDGKNTTALAGECERRGLSNLQAIQANWPAQLCRLEPFDLVIATEVIEHLREEPGDFTDSLESLCAQGGKVVISYPSSPPAVHERAEGEEERMEHVRFIEHADAQELWGHKAEFNVRHYGINKTSARGEPLHGAVASWRAGEIKSSTINVARKLAEQMPWETLSVCIISKWDEPALEKTLRSIQGIAHEIIVGIDPTGGTGLKRSSSSAWGDALRAGCRIFELTKRPLTDGFAAARNETIERASGDWILWIDADEEMIYPERLLKYLKPNMWQGYALAHLHYSAEPKGLLKEDLPCRVFRRNAGLKFHGIVHEHPGFTAEAPPEHVMILGDSIAIAHGGYSTEEVRRKRFERNFGLMRKEYQAHPERALTKFLWIRDLVQNNRFTYQQTGQLTPAMHEAAKEAAGLWRVLVDAGEVRMALDSLVYYSEAVDLLTGGRGIVYEFGCAMNSLGLGDNINGAAPESHRGRFLSDADAEAFTLAVIRGKSAPYREAYF